MIAKCNTNLIIILKFDIIFIVKHKWEIKYLNV